MAKLCILLAYVVLVGFSINGLASLKSYFHLNLYVTEDHPEYEYLQVLELLHPQLSWLNPVTAVQSKDVKFTSKAD